MESNLERANLLRGRGAKPRVCRSQSTSQYGAAAGGADSRATEGTLVDDVNDGLKGSSCGACLGSRRVRLRARPREWRSTGPAIFGRHERAPELTSTHETSESFPGPAPPPPPSVWALPPSTPSALTGGSVPVTRNRPASRFSPTTPNFLAHHAELTFDVHDARLT
jgi:hypothetical protein